MMIYLCDVFSFEFEVSNIPIILPVRLFLVVTYSFHRFHHLSPSFSPPPSPPRGGGEEERERERRRGEEEAEEEELL